jgi:hypothetical protein
MLRAFLCAFALLVSAPAVADQAKIKLHPAVWADFQKYLGLIGSTGKGAYAIVPDGKGGAGAYCPAQRCKPGLYSTKAIETCEGGNPGFKCVIFAKDREIQLDYEIGE